MKKYLKYLLSFLLIFGLTTGDYAINAQNSTANYHQVSFLSSRKGFNGRHSKLYVSNAQFRSKEVSSIAPFNHRVLLKYFNAKIEVTIKLWEDIFYSINTSNLQHLFLNKTITSRSYYPSLYMA